MQLRVTDTLAQHDTLTQAHHDVIRSGRSGRRGEVSGRASPIGISSCSRQCRGVVGGPDVHLPLLSRQTSDVTKPEQSRPPTGSLPPHRWGMFNIARRTAAERNCARVNGQSRNGAEVNHGDSPTSIGGGGLPVRWAVSSASILTSRRSRWRDCVVCLVALLQVNLEALLEARQP